MPVPPAKLKLGKVLLSLAPWLTLRADPPVAGITHNPAMQEMYRSDGLRHNRIALRSFLAWSRGARCCCGARRDPYTGSAACRGEDPILPRSTREFYDRLASEDKTLLLYPRMLHEPFNELGRERVFDDLAGWISRTSQVTGRLRPNRHGAGAPGLESIASSSGKLGLGDLDRLEQPRALLTVSSYSDAGDAVVDDAAAGLDVGRLALDDQGPQGDARVHVAGEVDVADRAGVGPALRAARPRR